MIIYKITNKINGKIYIGQTVNTLNHRWNQHIRETFSIKKRTYFHNAIAKYGVDAFIVEVIEEVDTVEKMNEREVYWISFYQSNDKRYGYNIDAGGHNSRRAESTKQKIGETTKEKWQNPEMRQKMLDGLRYGNEVWKEMCAKKKVEWVCPVCGKVMLLQAFDAAKRQFCSHECANKYKIDNGILKEQFERASDVNIVRKLTQNEKVSVAIFAWVDQNYQTVLHCPYNKISAVLQPLYQTIREQFGIKDWRTICEAVDVRYKKDFLNVLKQYIHENIC